MATDFGGARKRQFLPETTCGWVSLIVIVTLIIIAVAEFLVLTLTPCKGNTDVMFMLDRSASVNDTEYEKVIEFCNEIMLHKDIIRDKDGGIQFAIAQFATKAGMIQSFTDNPKAAKESLMNSKKSRIGVMTSLWAALYFVRDKMMWEEGSRKGARKVLIFMTDGNSEPETPLRELRDIADKLKSRDVVIYTIAVGDKIKNDELNVIATKENSDDTSYMFEVDSFEGLAGITNKLAGELCRPHYWLVAIPLGIIALVFVVQYFLDRKEAQDHVREETELMKTRSNRTTTR